MERGETSFETLETQVQKTKIELSENQLKVITNKYLKGDSPEQWMGRIAHNIALAEVLYSNVPDQKLLENPNLYYKRNEKGVLLVHEKGTNYKERSQNFHKFLDNIESYILNDKNVAKQVAETELKFYNLMANFYFLPNSPTLMNAGRELQQLSGCYVLPVEDSVEGWMKTAMDAAIVHKSGGGTGFSVSRVRPTGDSVQTTKGIASGPLSPLRIIDAMTKEIKQGGQRRGANMGILHYTHPNIEDFIVMKSKNDGTLEEFNISVGIDDKFMQAVKKNQDIDLINPKNGETIRKKNAKELFDLIVNCAWKSGDPGYVVLDRINNSASNPTPGLGQIESTNPCVVGSTLVSTEFGLIRMKDLVERSVQEEISIVTDNRVPIKIMNRDGTIMLMQLKQKGVSLNKISQAFSSGIKDVYRLTTNKGYEIIATQDHKIMTTEGWVELKNCLNKTILLQSGEGKFNENYQIPLTIKEDKKKLNLPKKWNKELGLAMGWLIGDGWLRSGDKNRRVGFTFSQEDKKVMNLLKPILNQWYSKDIKEVQRENKVYHLSYHSKHFVEFFEMLGIKSVNGDKKTVPETIYTAPKEAVTGFLQGLFAADGTISVDSKNGNYYVRLTSKSVELLKGVQVLLLNRGILSTIYDRSRKANEKFEYKGKKYYSDGILYELNISRENICTFLKEIGFLYKHENKINSILSHDFRRREFEDEVTEISYLGKEEVYDLTEPVTHSFSSNGIIVSNCGEQPLLPYEPCNLGSINLSKVVKDGKVDYKLLEGIVRDSIHFLDNVIDVNNYPLPEIEEKAKGNRRIGLGVMGWAEMLVKLRIPYDSKEAIDTAHKVMGFINETAMDASEKIADKRGSFPNYQNSIYDPKGEHFKGRAVKPRNSARTTIAPTGTIAIAAGLKGGGIEPFFGICYTRMQAEAVDAIKEGRTPKPEHVYKEALPEFLEVAEEWKYFGLSKDDLMDKIIANNGSVKGIKEIPENIRALFRCASDMDYKAHIDVQAEFQLHTDNAVSKTINMPNSATVEDIANAYMYAYEQGVKGLTIYRDGSKSVQVLNSNEKKETLEEKVSAVRRRPKKLLAVESKSPTPFGDVFTTYGVDSQGLRETFIKIGKAGSDISALTEALGRVISTGLKYNVPPEEFIEQLKGIKGSDTVGFGKDKILSIPDAVAKQMEEILSYEVPVLVETYKKLYDGKQKIEEKSKAKGKSATDLCPSCHQSTLSKGENCETCYACGFSKC